MKKMMTLLTTLLLLGWSVNAWSFACKPLPGRRSPSAAAARTSTST